jgi:hypothetical protein
VRGACYHSKGEFVWVALSALLTKDFEPAFFIIVVFCAECVVLFVLFFPPQSVSLFCVYALYVFV